MKSFVGFITILTLMVIGVAVFSFSLSYPKYEVRKSWTDLKVVEVLDVEGQKVNLTEADLKSRGEAYSVVWVAPR